MAIDDTCGSFLCFCCVTCGMVDLQDTTVDAVHQRCTVVSTVVSRIYTCSDNLPGTV